MADDPRQTLDVGGPHQAWRAGRRCPACQSRIVRGPYEVCQQKHAAELRPRDLTYPLDLRQRRLVERGYWNRWFFGGVAVCVLMVALLMLVLSDFGFVSVVVVAWLIPLSMLMAIVGLLFAPPLWSYPTQDRMRREIRASEPPGEE